MARSRKEKIKLSPEQRLVERWDQQVFFLQKQFPSARPLILGILKNHEKLQTKQPKSQAPKKATREVTTLDHQEVESFIPTEEALTELNDLFTSLKGKAGAGIPGLL